MTFLNEHKLTDAQSSFRPSHSCASQLPSIVYIYISFDCYPPWEARGIPLDNSKAFDSMTQVDL